MHHDIHPGDVVEIVEGSYAGFQGVILSIDLERALPVFVRVTTDWGHSPVAFNVDEIAVLD